MTALLACDGCGTIVSDRPDDDPTSRWWVLSMGPVIGGGLVLPEITFDVDDLDADEEEDLPLPEPPRHFCGTPCLLAWATRQEAS